MAKPKSGMYATKARNLTDAQLKRAGAAKAAAKRTVSVSDTTRATSGENKGYTLGAGGKRLTGTVIMANGDRAVYKDGKRVTNLPKSAAKKVTSDDRNIDKPETKITGLTPAQKAAKLFRDKKISSGMGRSTSTKLSSQSKTNSRQDGKSTSNSVKNISTNRGDGRAKSNTPARGDGKKGK